jgi:hypothetical protein
LQQRLCSSSLAAARWRWRSSSLQQHLCSSLGCGTRLKPLVETLAQQRIAAALVQQLSAARHADDSAAADRGSTRAAASAAAHA